jgi:hypothetical protein
MASVFDVAKYILEKQNPMTTLSLVGIKLQFFTS